MKNYYKVNSTQINNLISSYKLIPVYDHAPEVALYASTDVPLLSSGDYIIKTNNNDIQITIDSVYHDFTGIQFVIDENFLKKLCKQDIITCVTKECYKRDRTLATEVYNIQQRLSNLAISIQDLENHIYDLQHEDYTQEEIKELLPKCKKSLKEKTNEFENLESYYKRCYK